MRFGKISILTQVQSDTSLYNFDTGFHFQILNFRMN